MIGKLKGTAGGVIEGVVLVEVEGVGYAVHIPLQAFPKEGAEVSYFIYTSVRDDAIDLYGFPTREELAFFKQLLGVSGIGPKTALGVLNLADVRTLKRAIAQGDATMLTKVFGLGKKSAERIVVELRDKLMDELAAAPASGSVSGEDVEVLEALMALGYRADESRQALKKVPAAALGVRERLSAALKNLGTRERA